MAQQQQGKVNLNSASKEDLAKLTGIGDIRAQHIVDYRNQHGPFKDVEDLKKVPGFSDQLMDVVRPNVTV